MDDERVLAVGVAEQAKLGVTGLVLVGSQVGVKDRQVDAGNAILITEPLVGKNNADHVGVALLGKDERAALPLLELNRLQCQKLSPAGLDCLLNPVFVPAFGIGKGTKFLGGKVLDSVYPSSVFNISCGATYEQVRIQIEGTQYGTAFLFAKRGNSRLARLTKLTNHALRLALGASELLLKYSRNFVCKVRCRQHHWHIKLRELRLEIVKAERRQGLFLRRLPKLAGNTNALLLDVIGQKLNLAVHIGHLRLDQPAHEVGNHAAALDVVALDWRGRQRTALESHTHHRNLLVDQVVGEVNAKVTSAIPRCRVNLGPLAGVLLAVSGLAGPEGVARLVVLTALVDVRLALGNGPLESILQGAKIGTVLPFGSQL